MPHPRTAILEAFREAFANLLSQPTFTDSVARPVGAHELPVLTVVPGLERIAADEHSGSGLPPTVRRLRVLVVCKAETREKADALAFEVEEAAPYESPAFLSSSYAGMDAAEDGKGDPIVFATVVNFDVLYEVRDSA